MVTQTLTARRPSGCAERWRWVLLSETSILGERRKRKGVLVAPCGRGYVDDILFLALTSQATGCLARAHRGNAFRPVGAGERKDQKQTRKGGIAGTETR